MKKLHRFNAREKCTWVALTTSFLILCTAIGSTLLLPAASRAFEHTDQITLSSPSDNYKSPQQCHACHAGEYEAWSSTSHADASFDPLFQAYREREAEPGQCFSCHTTGYDVTTGQFALAGVTCEACHGPYRPGHPDEGLLTADSEDLCGTCHKGTLAEWASSRHSRAGVTCADCHEVHTQKTHAADVANGLCAGCHQGQTQDSVHTIHIHNQTGLYCADCHLARVSGDASDKVKGQIATGHAFAVVVDTCGDCHIQPLPIE